MNPLRSIVGFHAAATYRFVSNIKRAGTPIRSIQIPFRSRLVGLVRAWLQQCNMPHQFDGLPFRTIAVPPRARQGAAESAKSYISDRHVEDISVWKN